jgi:hypothetical protein
MDHFRTQAGFRTIRRKSIAMEAEKTIVSAEPMIAMAVFGD